jgi:hypothetical protein
MFMHPDLRKSIFNFQHDIENLDFRIQRRNHSETLLRNRKSASLKLLICKDYTTKRMYSSVNSGFDAFTALHPRRSLVYKTTFRHWVFGARRFEKEKKSKSLIPEEID